VSRNEIYSLIAQKGGGQFSREVLNQDIDAITAFYRNEGFLFVNIDSAVVTSDDVGRAVDITLRIIEGKPAVVHSLDFRGNISLSAEELRSAMETALGARFRQSVLERDVHAVLQRYERAGYPFTKVSIHNILSTEGEEQHDVQVVLSIEEGEAVRITEFLVEGNTTTRYDVILREARLQTGEVFHPDLPVRIQRRLQRTQLFSSVTVPALFVCEDGTAGFSVRVAEGNPNRFDGVVGYVPSVRAGESGYFTGLADVQLRNLFGTGRKLSARWQRENQSTQEIELRYSEPWVASYPVNVEAGFFQRQQDSSYVRRSYDIEAEFMLTEEFRVGASLAQQDVIPSEGGAGFVVSESQTTTIGGFLFYDSRDDALTPTQGFVCRMDYRTGAKKRVLGQSTASSNTQRFGLDFEYYLSVVSRQVLAASVHAREFRSGGMEISDLFRIGGANTLRGYREGQFLGSRIAWSNIEYRFLVSPRSFFYLFADAGYVSSPDLGATGSAAIDQTKVGYGAGLRVDTSLGLIGVSLALGEGDTFSTAKLHLRLVNEF
ncbi:MAG: BamA/TamA family outer membrane protein, partial [Ignavibacteriae bacterium]|nr:BamA/TamA family outer membrane protein [Ignavibacteriota bacterium]